MMFAVCLSVLVAQRLLELAIARRNERWLRAHGAVEYGQRHYPVIVAMHAAFIAALIGEYLWHGSPTPEWAVFAVVGVLFAVKIWTIASLGTFWNTKILRVPGAPSIRRGPYKFLRHPNYIIVVFEIALIPLVFDLYVTAIVFTMLNAAMLRVRIAEENRVWAGTDRR